MRDVRKQLAQYQDRRSIYVFEWCGVSIVFGSQLIHKAIFLSELILPRELPIINGFMLGCGVHQSPGIGGSGLVLIFATVSGEIAATRDMKNNIF